MALPLISTSNEGNLGKVILSSLIAISFVKNYEPLDSEAFVALGFVSSSIGLIIYLLSFILPSGILYVFDVYQRNKEPHTYREAWDRPAFKKTVLPRTSFFFGTFTGISILIGRLINLFGWKIFRSSSSIPQNELPSIISWYNIELQYFIYGLSFTWLSLLFLLSQQLRIQFWSLWVLRQLGVDDNYYGVIRDFERGDWSDASDKSNEEFLPHSGYENKTYSNIRSRWRQNNDLKYPLLLKSLQNDFDGQLLEFDFDKTKLHIQPIIKKVEVYPGNLTSISKLAFNSTIHPDLEKEVILSDELYLPKLSLPLEHSETLLTFLEEGVFLERLLSSTSREISHFRRVLSVFRIRNVGANEQVLDNFRGSTANYETFQLRNYNQMSLDELLLFMDILMYLKQNNLFLKYIPRRAFEEILAADEVLPDQSDTVNNIQFIKEMIQKNTQSESLSEEDLLTLIQLGMLVVIAEFCIERGLNLQFNLKENYHNEMKMSFNKSVQPARLLRGIAIIYTPEVIQKGLYANSLGLLWDSLNLISLGKKYNSKSAYKKSLLMYLHAIEYKEKEYKNWLINRVKLFHLLSKKETSRIRWLFALYFTGRRVMVKRVWSKLKFRVSKYRFRRLFQSDPRTDVH